MNQRGGRGKALESLGERPGDAEVDLSTPEGLTPEAVEVWHEAVWLAKDHLVPSDLFRLRRWIWWVDRWHRETQALQEEESVVSGSRGQPARNPRWSILELCERQIEAGEAVMGLNPQARMRLGITIRRGEEAWRKLKADRQKPAPTPTRKRKA